MKESPVNPALKTAFIRLLRIYEAEGYRVQIGINPLHAGGEEAAPFTFLSKNGQPVDTGGGGVALQEIYFLEHLSQLADFRSIFIVGNSFGWSTILMALLWPKAEICAIDLGTVPPAHWMQRTLDKTAKIIAGDPDPMQTEPDYGIKLTNEIAARHNLNARAIKGCSPQDVAAVAKHLREKPDFAFIDGYHIPSQVILDYEAIQKIADPDCVYLFHDVVNFKMESSIDHVRKHSRLKCELLWRTSSGMALAYPPEQHPKYSEFVRAFSESPETVRRVRERRARRQLADTFKRSVLRNPVLQGVKSLLVRKK